MEKQNNIFVFFFCFLPTCLQTPSQNPHPLTPHAAARARRWANTPASRRAATRSAPPSPEPACGAAHRRAAGQTPLPAASAQPTW